MKIAIGSDHRGFNLKCHLKKVLTADGHEIIDFGCQNTTSVDYPDFAHQVVRSILKGESERGILICATGVGMCIAANKFKGIRAATCTNIFMAKMSRLHNDANILCLGAEVVGYNLAEAIVEVWLSAKFTNEERHLRRIKKMETIE